MQVFPLSISLFSLLYNILLYAVFFFKGQCVYFQVLLLQKKRMLPLAFLNTFPDTNAVQLVIRLGVIVIIVQLISCVRFFVTPWTVAHQASLSFTTSQSLLKLMSIESMMPSNHFVLCCPLLILPSILLRTRVFSDELTFHLGSHKYWGFSFRSVLPMNIQSWFPLGLTSVISFQSMGLSSVFFNTTDQKHQFFSVLSWRTPGTVEPGGLPSLGLHRVEHNWSNLAAAAASALWSNFHIYTRLPGKP